jgi:hypothetical protein
LPGVVLVGEDISDIDSAQVITHIDHQAVLIAADIEDGAPLA